MLENDLGNNEGALYRGKQTKLVTLLITTECNLRCTYCYVHQYSGNLMSLEIAQKVIQESFATAVGMFDRIEFAFLGGEPFCAFRLLREICEWTWQKQWPLPYLFSASTNGTLLGQETRQWLIKHHRQIYLSLSYDGLTDGQDKNRCASGRWIDLRFFRRYWPDIPVKMTIMEQNVSHLFENIQHLNQIGLQVNDTFADGVPAWSDTSLKKLDHQLSLLCDAQLRTPQRHPSDLLSVDLTAILSVRDRNLFSCGAGDSRITYDWDGVRYACHLLSPLCLTKVQLDGIPDQLHAGRDQTDKCRTCPLDNICPHCEGYSYRMYQSIWRREEKNCSLFRHQLFFACRFQMKQILNKDKLCEHDLIVFQAVRKVLMTKVMHEIASEISC